MITPAIMSRFDLLFVVLDENSEKTDYNLARHIVSIHQKKDAALRPPYSTIQLQRYIKFAKTIRPKVFFLLFISFWQSTLEWIIHLDFRFNRMQPKLSFSNTHFWDRVILVRRRKGKRSIIFPSRNVHSLSSLLSFVIIILWRSSKDCVSNYSSTIRVYHSTEWSPCTTSSWQ